MHWIGDTIVGTCLGFVVTHPISFSWNLQIPFIERPRIDLSKLIGHIMAALLKSSFASLDQILGIVEAHDVNLSGV